MWISAVKAWCISGLKGLYLNEVIIWCTFYSIHWYFLYFIKSYIIVSLSVISRLLINVLKYMFCESIICIFIFSAGNDVTLHAGNHLFPFQFVLPINIPGSFEGKSSCYVRYWLKANIDRPWKFDPEYKMCFSVGGLLDLNTQANAMVGWNFKI